jgi:hypothetical protein
MAEMGGQLSFAGALSNGEVAPKPAVRLSWVERVKPTLSGRWLPLARVKI